MTDIQSLVTDNLDIWTTAIESKSTSGRGNGKKFSLYGIKKLRELILELAVRGKLVPQDENDEPASVLLEKIAAEKNQLIKEKKIKKPKKLPKIEEDEKPYELPKGWEWAYLGNLSSNIHYGYTASANIESSGVRLLRITDIQNDKVNWETVPGCEITEIKAQDYLLENNDVLIARTGGTIGKSYLVENISTKAIFASYLIRVKRISAMYSPFIKTYLGSATYWQQLYENASGTGQPNVNATALKSLFVPVPPESEQQRIVAKVDELMALCDQLEQETEAGIEAHKTLVATLIDTLTNSKTPEDLVQNWNRISDHFDTLFTSEDSIDKLKRTVIQLVATGRFSNSISSNIKSQSSKKGVDHCSTRKNIMSIAASDKKAMISSGEAKEEKIKPLAIENPYAITPESWISCKLNEVTSCLDHRRVPIKKSERSGGNVPYYGANGPVGFIGEKLFDEELVLVVEDETFIGREKPFSYVINGPSWVNNHAHVLKCTSVIIPKFLNIILSYYPFIKLTSGTTGRKKLTKNTLLQIPLLIAPLHEQHSIVTKVDQLMNLCDQLKSRIYNQQTTQLHLANSLIEQVVA